MASTTTQSPPTGARLDHRWLALVVIAVAQLMTALDATIVNIALPTAQHALGFSDAERQWVVTAYTVSFAGLLLLGGRISDVIGRRRAFQISLGGFAAASLLAGLAPNLGVLIAGRALQGAFAALVSPTVMSLLAVTFTEAKERTRAFAVFGAVASGGASVGLLLGGVLTEYADWRWCLLVNVAVAAGLLGAGMAVLPDPPRFKAPRIDVVSAVLATGGLGAVVFGCSQAASHGWAALVVTGSLGSGFVALSAFAVRQSQVGEPLLPLRILADRNRLGAYLAAASAVVGVFGMFLMLTYYLQVVRHYSPMSAGLAVLPLTVVNAISGYQLGTRLQPRLAPRMLIAGGLLLGAAGLAVLSRLTPTSSFVVVVLPAEVLIGLGMGALFPAAFQLAIRGVGGRDVGVASAVINASTQVGSSVGTAVLNTVAVSATTSWMVTRGHVADVAALVHGYATATAWSAGWLAGMAVVAFVLIDSPHLKEN